MIALSIVLLIIGLICLLAELLIPGFGIFGIIGIICIVISWWLTVSISSIGILIVIIEIIAITIVAIIIIKKLKYMQIYSRIILNDVVGSCKKEVGNIDDFIGREGVAKTDLKPFGKAEFNGALLDVYSENGYIKLNQKIKVIRVNEGKMYVVQINMN